jgi:hypothetical protein
MVPEDLGPVDEPCRGRVGLLPPNRGEKRIGGREIEDGEEWKDNVGTACLIRYKRGWLVYDAANQHSNLF